MALYGGHGYRNVTASYGTSEFTENHLMAFWENDIQCVYITYDRDEAGEYLSSVGWAAPIDI
ncbi:MAG: hypothetical protein F6K19_45865 [Cyanothece sp. SIO1E1]|nr:hypothetical protein [Cyanothece sp. SIO1E1]